MIAAAINIGMAILGGLGRVLQFLRPAAPWILAAVAGALIWQFLPAWGAGARLAAVQGDLATMTTSRDDWRTSAGEWEASFRAAESTRVRERGVAQAAANNLIQQCAARVEEARRSARVIERIVTKEPTYDENRCPVRELVDPGQLRDALGPTPAGRGSGAPGG